MSVAVDETLDCCVSFELKGEVYPLTEAKRADNEATRATNESALKDVARAEVKAERRKGRFNLIKGVVFGLLVGAGAGIAIGYSH